MRPFKPEHYHRAALERMQQAHVLYRNGTSFALAMYIAGVAVESILRAFKARRDDTFDERHDLRRLFQASRILDLDAESLTQLGLSAAQALAYPRELQAGVNDIWVLWANDYRFASEDRLRAHLKKDVALRSKIKGDILKSNARRLVDAAQGFVTRGHLLWMSSRK